MAAEPGPTEATLAGTAVPRLARHVRMRFDRARGTHVLLGPESVVVLNATGADTLERCDGRTVDEIVDDLERHYDAVGNPAVGTQVRAFLTGLADRNCLRIEEGT